MGVSCQVVKAGEPDGGIITPVDEVEVVFEKGETLVDRAIAFGGELVGLANVGGDTAVITSHPDLGDDAVDLLDNVLNRYIESQVYRAAVENVACEMASKMVAMKSATESAGDFIDELQLVYNKARQAAITQEISEIVGGAAAV